MIKSIRRATLAASVAVFVTGQAFALDVDLDAFVELFNASSSILEIVSARIVDETIVVDGMKVADAAISIDGVFTFTGIVAQPHGGFVIDTVSAPELVFRDAGTGEEYGSLKDLLATGYVLPGVPGSPMAITPMTLSTGQLVTPWLGVPVSVGSLSASLQPTLLNDDVTALTATWTAKDFDFGLSLQGDGRKTEAGKVLAAMDIDSTAFDITQSVTWTDDGSATLSAKYDFHDLASLESVQSFSGLTKDKLGELMYLIAAVQAGPQHANPMDIAGASAVIGVAIDGAEFRYDDHSLLPKVINYLALTQGGRDGAIAMLENYFMTSVDGLEVAALSALIRPKLQEFLKEPSSLEVRFAPKAPVSLIAFSVASAMNKAGLIPLLGIQVAANEPPRPDAP